MKMLPFSLGLGQASQQELADVFDWLAQRHHTEYEIHEGCKLFARWSRAHLHALDPFVNQYGRKPNSDPARLRRALFHGRRVGGFGLLRDLQDLLLLIHQTRTAWTSLGQAAKAMKDMDLDRAVGHCATDLDRQVDWTCTHIKSAAPQALTVPLPLSEELKSSLPKIEAHHLVVGTLVIGAVGLAAGLLRGNSRRRW